MTGWCSFAHLLQATPAEDELVALDPAWRRIDFIQSALQLSAYLKAQQYTAAALWHSDAAHFSCALLACLHAGVDVYVPPNMVEENRRWADAQADVWLLAKPQEGLGKPCLLWFEDAGVASTEQTQMMVGALDMDVAVFLKTSGSSGQAQVIRKTVAQLQAEAEALAVALPLPSVADAVVGSVAVQHLYGLTFRVVLALCAGWPMWRTQCVYPENLLEATGEHEQVVWVASPTLLQALLVHGWSDEVARKHVWVFSAGGLLSQSLAQAWANQCVRPVQEIYGSTETGVIAARTNGQAWRFLPTLTYQTDAEGVLAVCSPWSAGWQQTADVIEPCTQGFVLLGRKDHIIKLADKRVALTQVAHDLQQHLWVADAHCVRHKCRQRVVAWVALSQAGIHAWRSQGRKAVIQDLRQHLAMSHEGVALPRYWRFDTVLPRNQQGKLAADDVATALAQRPTTPRWQQVSQGDDGWFLQADVPLDLVFFSGHFSGFPLVPGVVQMQWVLEAARGVLSLPDHVIRVENLKFQQFLRPADTVGLCLQWQPEKHKLLFRLEVGDRVCASGRVVFAEDWG